MPTLAESSVALVEARRCAEARSAYPPILSVKADIATQPGSAITGPSALQQRISLFHHLIDHGKHAGQDCQAEHFGWISVFVSLGLRRFSHYHKRSPHAGISLSIGFGCIDHG